MGVVMIVVRSPAAGRLEPGPWDRKEFDRWKDLFHLSSLKEHGGVADPSCLIHVVGDHHEGQPPIQIEGRDEGFDLPGRCGIERCGRFVHEQDLGIVRQSPGNADPLLLPHRKVPGVAVCKVRGQGHRFKDGGNIVGGGFNPCSGSIFLIPHDRSRSDVLPHGSRKEDRDLEDHTHLLSQLPGVQGKEGNAVQEDIAGLRFGQPVQGPEEHGFSSSRGADNGEYLPFQNSNIDSTQNCLSFQGFHQVLNLDLFVHGGMKRELGAY